MAASVDPAGVQAQIGSDRAIALIDIRSAPLSVDEVLAAVTTSEAGGIALFVGAVRDHDGGRAVSALGYTAHPTALSVLQTVAEGVVADLPTVRLAAIHRTGELVVGDLAVVVAAAGSHREAAFAACRALIDNLKEQVPIWKHQRFADGTQEWVGSP
ncbi:MAG: molybdenum cofactor biosynthesis protein MoaE [Frankiaceae bacterium]|jgi:molybdopterin synthase catalytic subunit